MSRGDDRRERRDSDAQRRPLRIVVLGSRDSGKATIVSSVLRWQRRRRQRRNDGGGGEKERVVESRHQAYHELHVHRHRRGGERDRREDEGALSAAVAAPPNTRDTRYDRVVLNWFKARFRSLVEEKKRRRREGGGEGAGEEAAATSFAAAAAATTVVLVEETGRCGGKCCTRALVLYELLYYDDSIGAHTTDDDDRRAILYAENADVVVIAYDPRDEKSVRCALRLLGAIGRRKTEATTTTRWRDNNSSGHFRPGRSIVLIECDTGSVATPNPNAIRSLRNYYDAVEVAREQRDDSDDDAVVIDNDDDGKQRCLFARLSCRHGGGGGGNGDHDERRRRALMDRVLTRAIAPIVRIRSSGAAAARSAYTASWIPAASTPTAESSVSRDRTTNYDDGCRLDNAINELCDD